MGFYNENKLNEKNNYQTYNYMVIFRCSHLSSPVYILPVVLLAVAWNIPRSEYPYDVIYHYNYDLHIHVYILY